MSFVDLIESNNGNNFGLHSRYLNHQFVNVLNTLGFNKTYVKAEGSYLIDQDGERYLDLLSGYGVYAFGRNHPRMIRAIKETLDAELPNLVQFDCPTLAGCFAEKLAARMPAEINKFFFCNSGTEAIEGSIKFARAATKRSKMLYCGHAFHGLSTGALSLNGSDVFKRDFGPLLPGSEMIPFDDLDSLESALKTRDFAGFVIEPIQGKGVYIPANDFLPEASRLCKKYGSLLIVDEIQTGIGRTGKFLAIEHCPGTEPDIITMAKALSGGFVPVGVIAMKNWIFDKTFRNMESAVVHSCTFGRNNLAMAAGIETLNIIDDEKLIEQAAENGSRLLDSLRDALLKYEFVEDVRGRGMMIGIEFGLPTSLSLKTAWKLLEAANKGLFCQMIVIPLFEKHKMLTQVAGHNSYVVKLIPALNMSPDEIPRIVAAIDDVVADTHRFPGAIWDLGKTLAGHSIKSKMESTV